MESSSAPSIRDPEVVILATYSQTQEPDYRSASDKAWMGSPFGWIRIKPSRQRGKIGEDLIAGYLACKGFDVCRSPDVDADRIVGGKRAEIKMSMLWETGIYKFQQMRDQDYDFAICLGISPFDAHCWVLPKAVVIERWQAGDIQSQHRGREGKDTAWISVRPVKEPDWINPWGGRLTDAVRLISRITGQDPSR